MQAILDSSPGGIRPLNLVGSDLAAGACGRNDCVTPLPSAQFDIDIRSSYLMLRRLQLERVRVCVTPRIRHEMPTSATRAAHELSECFFDQRLIYNRSFLLSL